MWLNIKSLSVRFLTRKLCSKNEVLQTDKKLPEKNKLKNSSKPSQYYGNC